MSRPTETPHASMQALHDAEVADWVEARARAVVLFWDADDAVCGRQRERVEVVAAAMGIPAASLDVRSERLVARALGVKSVPTTVVFRGGEVVERIMGAAPEPILEAALREAAPHLDK